MNIISAIGSFKGSIDSTEINNLVKQILEQKGHFVDAIPVADGGDGLLQALGVSLDAEYIEIETENALGKKTTAKVGISNNIGIVEMALASGLALLNESEYNPLKASTYGTGVLIKALSQRGIKNIILGIGGSATNDGGFGCLSALGFELFDENGNLLTPCGENLSKVKKISAENVSEEIKNLNIQIACDVTNPLLGENGATYIYAPQKGATVETLPILESGMKNYAQAVAEFCSTDFSTLPGTGAAGGLGFGLLALLDAKLQKGAEIVLECANFDKKLQSADLLITGEGRIDNQTAFGKLPQIVASKGKSQNVKCIAICGSSIADRETLKEMGIDEVYQLTDFAPLDECMNNTAEVVKRVLEKIF